MALALENANLVWQKAKNALMNANPATQMAFAGLKTFLSQQKNNPDLEFYAFSEVQADDADGTGIVDAGNQLYAVFVKKEDEGTDAYFKIFDNATVDTTTTQQRIVLPIFIAKEETFQIYPDGFPFANGCTVTQHTTSEGTTDSSTGGDGFLIVGAA
jgi:hypothetical protein